MHVEGLNPDRGRDLVLDPLLGSTLGAVTGCLLLR